MACKMVSPLWTCGALVLLAAGCLGLGQSAPFKYPSAASNAALDDWSDPSYLELLARVGEAAEHRLHKNEFQDALSPEMLDDPVEAFRLQYSTPLARDKSAPLHTADTLSLKTPHAASLQQDINLELLAENDVAQGDYLPSAPYIAAARRPSYTRNVQPLVSSSGGLDGLSPQCSPCGPPPCPIPCYYPVPVYMPIRRPTPPPATTTSTTTTTTSTTAAPATAPPEHQRPPPYLAPPVPTPPCEASVEIPICIQYLINLATIIFGIWLLKWYCSTMAAYDQECGLDDRAHGGAGNGGAFRGLSATRSSFVAPPFATISAYYDPVTNQVVLPQEYQAQQQQSKYDY